MRKFLLSIFLLASLLPIAAKAQFERLQDSVVQLYGVVMSADSLRGLPAVSVMLKGQNRGTITNDQGVFSIVVLKGDEVEFTSIGYKPVLFSVPKNIVGREHSVIQLMTEDTVYLPATIIRPRPTREQFERDFVKANIPEDEIELARKNNNEATRRFLIAALPTDAREASNQYFQRQATKATYYGQAPPQNIFNPFAWNEFIKAWKRGDYKKK